MASQTEAKEAREILGELPKPEAVQFPEPDSYSGSDYQNGAGKRNGSYDDDTYGYDGKDDTYGYDGKENKGVDKEFQLGVAVSVYQNSG